MPQAILVTAHLVGPTTVELDAPVADPASQVEVVIRPPATPLRVPDATEFWTERSAEQLAAEQGVSIPQRSEDFFGRGAELWESDEEFQEFVRGLHERRQSQGRNGHAP